MVSRRRIFSHFSVDLKFFSHLFAWLLYYNQPPFKVLEPRLNHRQSSSVSFLQKLPLRVHWNSELSWLKKQNQTEQDSREVPSCERQLVRLQVNTGRSSGVSQTKVNRTIVRLRWRLSSDQTRHDTLHYYLYDFRHWLSTDANRIRSRDSSDRASWKRSFVIIIIVCFICSSLLTFKNF